MSADHLDPVAILTGLGYDNPRSVEPVGGGRDTTIWRVEHGGTAYALRVFRPEQAPVVPREVAAMRAAAAGGVPVPEVHAVDASQRHPAMLLSWREDRTVVAELASRPERAWELGVLSGELLARINAVTAPEKARSWREGPGAVEPPLSTRLDTLARGDALLHLDFHPLNLLTDGQRITAVLDWTNARAGDPRADLARSISILRLDTGELSPHEQSLARQYERGLRRGYGPVSEFAPYLAWAGAFMLNDIRRRSDATADQRRRIEAWVARWQRRAGAC
ncbi:MAG TPA: aminoglycoside phosphotransferase family protein [Thermomicrobiales bacterium]|nr:aminoglycoside phosphotransferase family protein [Thermomicrobiales bacterium]